MIIFVILLQGHLRKILLIVKLITIYPEKILLISYHEINCEVIKKVDNSRYGNGNDIRLVNLGPIALFSNFKLTMSSGKHL